MITKPIIQETQQTKDSSALGLWIDDLSSAKWAEAARAELLPWLAALAGGSEAVSSLAVSVKPPTQAEAKDAFESNLDLRGQVICEWNGQTISLSFPMPFHGIFLSSRNGYPHAMISVWASWLTEAPGFRLLRRANEHRLKSDKNRRQIKRKLNKYTTWRIGMPGGRHLEGHLSGVTKKQANKLRGAHYFGALAFYPEWLREHFCLFGRKGTSLKAQVSWDTIRHAIRENADSLAVTAEDDLEHRRLMTFPVWLKYQLSYQFRHVLTHHPEIKARILSVFSGAEPGDLSLAEDAWTMLQRQESQHSVQWRIEDGISAHKSKDSVDFVDPVNPLDLISRITRVRRLQISRRDVAILGAAKRQNHPSFRGRLCPVESPESEQVGICLQLASGARVDFDGRIHSSAGDPAVELGFGAGLIPFFAHNDGARNMMGAKNLRQAVPVLGRQRPKIETGGELIVQSLTAPLIEIGACPDANVDGGGFALGRDLLVAYLPWYGLNVEDAMVVGEQVVQNGWLDLSFKESFHKPIRTGFAPKDLPGQVVLAWSKDGKAKLGTKLIAGSPIASFAWEGKEEVEPFIIKYEGRTPAILRKLEFPRKSPWLQGVLEYDLEIPIALKPGDKLMGRHGNKGVVAAILPISKMPRLPDSDALPKEFRGRPIDVLLNPHGVISRMNLGQLIETHIGWLLHCRTRPGDLMNNADPCPPIAAPFAKSLDHERVQKLLEQTGLDSFGRIHLELPGGGQTLSPVTVGFQHIVRLDHVPEQKSQARRGGKDARYAARSGQAVRGRKLGGGQRVGEMEIWALAAHGAHAVVEEMRGIKSNKRFAGSCSHDVKSEIDPVLSGFPQRFQDWAFAMMIQMEKQDNLLRFRFADENNVLDRAGALGKVLSPVGLSIAPTARFACIQGGKKPCSFDLLEGARIAFPDTAEGEDVKAPALSFGDLLAHLRLRADGPLQVSGSSFLLPLKDLDTCSITNPLLLEFDSSGKQLKALVRAKTECSPPRWPDCANGLALYAQLSASDGKNWVSDDLLHEFQKTPEEKRNERKAGNRGGKVKDRWVTDMRVACPEHPTSPLKGRKPFHRVRRAQPGGLFDPAIFGSGRTHDSDGISPRWGCIELPLPIEYPASEVLSSLSRAATGGPEGAGRWIKDLADSLDSRSLPKLRYLPVLPTQYRLPSYQGGDLRRDPIDSAYASVIAAAQWYSNAKDDDKKAAIAHELTKRVQRLLVRLAEALEGKNGLVRHDGLGRRVDRSARLVITPNPGLGWDQAGLPVAVLLEIMGDLVTEWLRHRSAEEQARNPLPQFSHAPWSDASEDPQLARDGMAALKGYLGAHPDFVVLLNRQPTLHRDGFQAFHPVPLPTGAGDVIQLCPLVCKAFAADFDGDEMVVHLPLGKNAQAEATKMLPSKVMFSLATDTPEDEEQETASILANFDQDFVLGTWWMSADKPEGGRARLIELLPGQCCKHYVESRDRLTKAQGSRLLEHIAKNHSEGAVRCIEAWMRAAFQTCTEVGVSFGFYELRKVAQAILEQSAKLCASPDRANESLSSLVNETLKGILTHNSELNEPALHFSAMALSGARGKKEQTRQILAARGMLDPGEVCFDATHKRFFFDKSLIEGLELEDAFFAAMNSRSSMCDKKLGTAYAGGLTRSLAFALWPHFITSEDCGSKEAERNPATCLASEGFCAACYGPVPNGDPVPVGFPAGLIAAQAIGERGTQLSMQSFHGSEKKVNIHKIRWILQSGKGFDSLPTGATNFVNFMKETDAYRQLSDRHFYILWKSLNSAPEHKLRSAIAGCGPLTRIAHRDSAAEMIQAAINNTQAPLQSPFARLLLGKFDF